MPKVSQEYIDQKKNLIVECAARVCDKKAVCSITMQDVIDESGLSQGGIYRFYQNIDDILIDVLKSISFNSLIDTDKLMNEFTDKIESLRNSDKSAKTLLKERRRCIYDFIVTICQSMSAILEKYQHPFFAIHFGFSDMILNYPERAKYIFSNVENPFSMKKEIKIIEKELSREVKDEVLKPRSSVDDILSYLRISFLGLNQSTLIDERYTKDIKGNKNYSGNISLKFKMIRQTCCYLLGLEEFEE